MIWDTLLAIWGCLFTGWREQRRRETMQVFGLSLASGLPLDTSIRMAAETSPWPPMRRAFAFLQQSQSQGYMLKDVVLQAACAEIAMSARGIIGSNLKDREKGEILQVSAPATESPWLRREGNLAYLLTEFAIGLLIMMAIGLFVIPQFEDIFLGMHLQLPLQTRILFKASVLFGDWAFGILLVAILLEQILKGGLPFLGRDARNAEAIEVMRILHNLDPGRIPEVLGIIGHPMILPFTGQGFKMISEALINNEPLNDAIAGIEIDRTSGWIIAQALQGHAGTGLFLEAAELLETRLTAKVKRRWIFLENSLTIGMGLFVALICTGVLLPLIDLLENI